jgi:BASS family bile acid:Na+ symporter
VNLFSIRLLDVTQVVFCPVLLGLALNTYAKPVVDIVRPGMPVMAMLCTSLCIGGPLALNRGHILSLQGLQLLFPVIAFHIAGFLFGYWMAMAPALRWV